MVVVRPLTSNHRGGHLVHFQNEVQHNKGLNLFDIKFIKEFQIMKGPLKVDLPITFTIDRHKIWAIPFSKNNVGAGNKDYRMYVY